MAGSGSLDVPSEAGPGSAAQAARGAEPRPCGHWIPEDWPIVLWCPWCGVKLATPGRQADGEEPGQMPWTSFELVLSSGWTYQFRLGDRLPPSPANAGRLLEVKVRAFSVLLHHWKASP